MDTVWVVLVLLLGAAAWQVVRRGRQMQRLADEGVDTVGEVVRTWGHLMSTGQRVDRLRYRFRTPDGKVWERSVVVTPGSDADLRAGGEARVVYLPDRPQVSALAHVVDQARAALASRRKA